MVGCTFYQLLNFLFYKLSYDNDIYQKLLINNIKKKIFSNKTILILR